MYVCIYNDDYYIVSNFTVHWNTVEMSPNSLVIKITCELN